MDTKTIKIMTKSFYEPWNQVDHVKNFAQRLDDQQVYLNGHDGIDITEANKLQFAWSKCSTAASRQAHPYEVGEA